MTRRQVVWPAEARAQFDRIAKDDPGAPELILPAVYQLGHDPQPLGSDTLGSSGVYRRLRIGERYRVTYAVTAQEIRIVLVARITGAAL